MANLKNKSSLILTVILLCCILFFAASAGSSSNSIIQQQNNTNSTPDSQLINESLSLNDSNSLNNSNYGSYTNELFARAMLTVVIVIVLGIAAIFLSKKLLPRISNLQGKQIKIIETVHLGPRRSVHLLEIGSKQLLIGCTNENINTLADLTAAETFLDKPDTK